MLRINDFKGVSGREAKSALYWNLTVHSACHISIPYICRFGRWRVPFWDIFAINRRYDDEHVVLESQNREIRIPRKFLLRIYIQL